jgi:glutathione peroxidase-family protein
MNNQFSKINMISKMAIILFLYSQVFAGGTIKLNSPAPDFTLKDHTGKTHTLSDYKGKIVVLEWINFSCPFVKKHYKSGNMQGLQEKYRGQDIVWLTICSSAKGKQGHYELSKIEEQLTKNKYKATAYLIDEPGDIGKIYEAKTTPHMYIINKEGILVYDGAIDSIPSAKIKDIKDADPYVVNMLDKMLKGEKITAKKTEPYGCSVKYR